MQNPVLKVFALILFKGQAKDNIVKVIIVRGSIFSAIGCQNFKLAFPFSPKESKEKNSTEKSTANSVNTNPINLISFESFFV